MLTKQEYRGGGGISVFHVRLEDREELNLKVTRDK